MDINLFEDFKAPKTIKFLAKEIEFISSKIDKNINIMEVCGGHTHTIVKYGLNQITPKNVNFIHGPGCPVCVMPKEQIDKAIILANKKDVILTTLGDMMKVPGSLGTLQQARANGSDVRFLYSPMDIINIAKKNPEKKVIFFAIGFETTTPMTPALIKKTLDLKIENLYFFINHITVPEPMEVLLQDDKCKIDAFIAPSHVSVITGSKIYEFFSNRYNKPIVVSGFEPVDVLQSLVMILKQIVNSQSKLENEYSRSVTYEGNTLAQNLITTYFKKRDFKWRGIGIIKNSAWQLKDEYKNLDAEVIYKNILKVNEIEDNKLCICGDILKGLSKPTDCKVFEKICTPQNPLGSCMVSSEGACSAYYKYGNIKLNILN